MQLSMTCDLPTMTKMINQLEFKEGYLTSNEALRTMYSDSSTVRLKRTARALAYMDVEEENFETSDRLPAIAHPLKLTAGSSCTNLPPQTTKRVLAPPPKTRIMPIGDPTELRALIEGLQARQREQMEKSATYNRLAACSPRTAAKPGNKAKLSSARSASNSDLTSTLARAFFSTLKRLKDALSGPAISLANFCSLKNPM